MSERKYTEKEIVEAGLKMYLCSMIHNNFRQNPPTKEGAPRDASGFDALIKRYIDNLKNSENDREVLKGFTDHIRRKAQEGEDIGDWEETLEEYRGNYINGV